LITPGEVCNLPNKRTMRTGSGNCVLERLLTLKEIAAAVQVSIPTLRRAVKRGELIHERVGSRGQVRISPANLQAWVSRRGGVVPGRTAEVAEGRGDFVYDFPTRTHPSAKPPRERTGDVGDGLSYRVITADVLAGLGSLAPKSVSAIVTSPPYYWQRDYEVDGQIGHEPTIKGYVDTLADVFAAAKVALADDGLLFLNIGDAYYNAKGKPHGRDRKHGARQLARQMLRAVDGPGLGLPRKSLIGLPWRVALALQDKGWTLRSSVIWHRPNTLGEATSHDRPWRTHENVFIFSKGPRYFFDREGLAGEEDIWTIKARPANPYAHCAPYPVELVEKCLACGCRPGGLVLDPFLGSGTTAIAALRTGRSAVGIELNDNYSALAEQRILDAFAEKAPATRRAGRA
jgi:excisionase family DNA binding protein